MPWAERGGVLWGRPKNKGIEALWGPVIARLSHRLTEIRVFCKRSTKSFGGIIPRAGRLIESFCMQMILFGAAI